MMKTDNKYPSPRYHVLTLQVQSVKWSENDTRLVSCGMDGNVFVWDVLVGNVVIRNEKTCSYADMAFSPTNGSIHCVDRSHIWEISNEGVSLKKSHHMIVKSGSNHNHSSTTVQHR